MDSTITWRIVVDAIGNVFPQIQHESAGWMYIKDAQDAVCTVHKSDGIHLTGQCSHIQAQSSQNCKTCRTRVHMLAKQYYNSYITKYGAIKIASEPECLS